MHPFHGASKLYPQFKIVDLFSYSKRWMIPTLVEVYHESPCIRCRVAKTKQLPSSIDWSEKTLSPCVRPKAQHKAAIQNLNITQNVNPTTKLHVPHPRTNGARHRVWA